MALGDVNGDGLDDLYLCQEDGLPNRLYVQNPDGTLSDKSEQAEVNWLEGSRSALLVDLDNDGDQDLAVAMMGGIVLAANQGDGRFEYQTLLPTADDLMSMSAADYDGDGLLDLYVCTYYQNSSDGPQSRSSGVVGGDFVYHDSNSGAPTAFSKTKMLSTFETSRPRPGLTKIICAGASLPLGKTTMAMVTRTYTSPMTSDGTTFSETMVGNSWMSPPNPGSKTAPLEWPSPGETTIGTATWTFT